MTVTFQPRQHTVTVLVDDDADGDGLELTPE